jgi:hypothetical protein
MFFVESKSYGYNLLVDQFDQSIGSGSVASQQEKGLCQNGLAGQQRWLGI